ncbi:MAG: nitroreductase family protein [Paludibacter sp.]|nr:nitroreductase family protein [Paludibacter sp.]MDD4199024.1 nitroreductase family protein [Paludibacter sp.]MDD4426793.1 nitroreductase family protein [Paludibacter sp.]
MTLIAKLSKRYASKQMNGKKLPQNKVDNILEAIRLAPTSMGLQPFKILVVESQEIKNKIFETAAPGQPQIPNASQVLIFACYRKVTDEILDTYFDLINKTRPMLAKEKVIAYRNMMNGLLNKTADENFQWAARQAYIALGFGLTAAAEQEVDSVPIEGYNPEALDKLLNLHERNLGSVCMFAIGFRNEETDYNARLPKVRKSTLDLFEFL